ncbi:hypothetical protein MHYP_G00178590 [Metynnis hypsauchen]
MREGAGDTRKTGEKLDSERGDFQGRTLDFLMESPETETLVGNEVGGAISIRRQPQRPRLTCVKEEGVQRTKCVGITAKTAGSTKAQPTPGWREVKDSSSSNELKGSAFQKAPAITDSSSSRTRGAAFSPRRPPGSASQPASLEGATARCRGGARERGPGPDGPF